MWKWVDAASLTPTEEQHSLLKPLDLRDGWGFFQTVKNKNSEKTEYCACRTKHQKLNKPTIVVGLWDATKFYCFWRPDSRIPQVKECWYSANSAWKRRFLLRSRQRFGEVFNSYSHISLWNVTHEDSTSPWKRTNKIFFYNSYFRKRLL